MTEIEQTFPLDPEKVYFSMDFLTLEIEGEEPKTLRIGSWLNYDPVRIHKLIVKDKVLKVDEFEVMSPLMSKLRRADPAYYKRIMGLKVNIDFPGYPNGVVAKIPFEDEPIAFYKWWRKGKNEEKVYLSVVNMFKLFQKVSLMDKKVMLKKDLDFLKTF
ncbi:MAG: hypothetical protein MJZ16_05910 [Bacteroidales bacterium]|nr:hypothetical protein [Bacteroidales bacterium]